MSIKLLLFTLSSNVSNVSKKIQHYTNMVVSILQLLLWSSTHMSSYPLNGFKSYTRTTYIGSIYNLMACHYRTRTQHQFRYNLIYITRVFIVYLHTYIGICTAHDRVSES
jgi:hypothetical protein